LSGLIYSRTIITVGFTGVLNHPSGFSDCSSGVIFDRLSSLH
jgi:hypothetical protein